MLVIFTVVLLAFLVPWWVTALCMLGYVMWHQGLELIVFMVLVDGYFGTLDSRPLLTLSAVAVVLAAAFLKPLLRVYTR